MPEAALTGTLTFALISPNVGSLSGSIPMACMSGIATVSSRDATSNATGSYAWLVPQAPSTVGAASVNTAGTTVSPNLTSNVVALKVLACSVVQASTAANEGEEECGEGSDPIVVGAGKYVRVPSEENPGTIHGVWCPSPLLYSSTRCDLTCP